MTFQPKRFWKTTTPPTAKVLTTAEAKIHLHEDLDDCENDLYIDALVQSATDQVEIFCSRALITQTITLLLDCFPWNSKMDVIYLPMVEIQNVESLKYIDEDGVQILLDPSLYQVDLLSEPGRIVPAPDESWPATQIRRINAVEVIYKAGYGDTADDVPEAIKSAMKLLIAGAYEMRESETDIKVEKNPAVERILWQYRQIEIK